MVAMSAEITAAGAAPTIQEKSDYELLLFRGKEAYVYQVPPASTVGHRAELWNVDKWIAEVRVKLVRFSNDQAFIILLDHSVGGDPSQSGEGLLQGEIFAECPVTLPLFTCVEPVIDSSRYFVIRVVDRESGRHVFLGLGFREREEASDFNAALAEHQSYLERKEAAASMRKAFDDAYKEEEGEANNSNNTAIGSEDGGGDASAASAAAQKHHQALADYSLKPGEKLHLKLGSSGNNSRNGQGFLSTKLTKTFSLMFDPENGGAAMAALAPPPPPSRTRLSKPTMGISPSYKAAAATAAAATAAAAAAKGEQEDDDTPWGEFKAAEIQE